MGQLGFVQNLGQWDSRAKFLAEFKGIECWVTDSGLRLDFHRLAQDPQSKPAHGQGTTYGHVVDMKFVEADTPDFTGMGMQRGAHNFIRGRDQSRWATGAASFGEVYAKNILPGVTSRYYMDGGLPRYDVIVGAGVDPSKIALELDGATSLSRLDNGDISIGTSLGSVIQKGLVAYQKLGSKTIPVTCTTKIEGNQIRFVLGDYDRSKPLVVDPLLWCSYLGGSQNGYDSAIGGGCDPSGNVILVGPSESTNFPTTTGAYMTTANGNNFFVSKISADGKSLIFSTLVGGNLTDTPTGVAVDASGNIFIGGQTDSTTFPTTAGAYQTSEGANFNPSFLCKISANGSSLLFSTYFNGSYPQFDVIKGVTLDASGNPVIVGVAGSPDFPVTAGAYQTSYNGAANIAYAAKLSSNGSSLLFSTLLGGTSTQQAECVAVDPSGNILVGGSTGSTDFPTSTTGYNRVFAGTHDNGFIAKLNSTGTTLLAGTYLSGSSPFGDSVDGLAADSSGNVYAIGTTHSPDFPTTAGALKTALGNSYANAYVTKFPSTLSSLTFSTLFGGSFSETALSIVLDKSGNPVIAGSAGSLDMPTTADAISRTLAGGQNDFGDAFTAKLSTTGALLYGTYFGGTGTEQANKVALDAAGNVFLIGQTVSGDLPGTTGTYQPNNVGVSNAFTCKISISSQQIGLTLAPSTVVGGQTSVATITLNPAAPAGGANLTYILNGANDGTIAAPAGATTLLLDLTTVPVDATGVAQIGISYNGASAFANLTITTPTVSVLTLSPNTVSGGGASTGTVTLNGAAGPSGVKVALSSNNAAVKVPSSITVPAGATFATFTATTTVVSSTVTGTVTATYNSVAKTATLKVLSVSLASLSLSPTSVMGGASSTGTVTLTSPAPTGGWEVDLSSQIPSYVGVPAWVTVAAGATTATFTITTKTFRQSYSNVITATDSMVTRTGTLSILDDSLSTVALSPSNVKGGSSSTGTVTLYAVAPAGGWKVNLTSQIPSYVSVPASVTVAAGATTATFTATTKTFRQTYTNNIMASDATSTKTATLTITDDSLFSVSLSPASVMGGSSSTGTVTLYGPAPAGGWVVNLTSQIPSYVAVPASVTVAAGATTATFTATTKIFRQTYTNTITAKDSMSSRTATLTVVDDSISGLTLSPSSVIGGTNSTGTITLLVAAPAGGWKVNLTSQIPSYVGVPASITIPAGSTTGTFTITTKTFRQTYTNVVTAADATSSKTATLTITTS